MITFAQIQDRIGSMRPDKLPREWQLAFQIGARRLATETLALQETVDFTVTAYAVTTELTWPDLDRECLWIFKAEWQKDDDSWEPMRLYNQEALKDLTRHTQNDAGLMKGFTSEQGKFRPNRPPSVDTQVRAVVAYQPVGDFDEVDFGREFEDALIEGALSHLMRLPGEQRDMNASELAERRFQSMASGLRGTTLIGDAGYIRASSKPRRLQFGGFMGQDRLRY